MRLHHRGGQAAATAPAVLNGTALDARSGRAVQSDYQIPLAYADDHGD